jgi:hypothetical protein
MVVAEPICVETGKLIVILLSLLIEAKFDVTDHLILTETPAGFVTICGSARIKGVPNI